MTSCVLPLTIDLVRATAVTTVRAGLGIGLIAVSLAACTNDRETFFRMGVTVRDSAGVRIVQTPAASMPLPSWKLESSPALDLTRRLAPAAAQSNSHIVSMTRLSDGRFVLIDRAACEIRFVHADGSPQTTAGGCGQGSGNAGSLWLAGRRDDDALVVWDNEHLRLTLVAPDGGILESTEFTAVPGHLTPWGVFSDGHLLVTFRNSAVPEHVATVVQDTFALWDFDPRSSERRLIVRKPGLQIWAHADRTEGIPFSGNPVFTAAGDDVLIASGEQRIIERWSREGSLLARYVDERPPTPLTERELSEYRDNELRSTKPASAAQRLRELNAMPYPRFKLAYDRLLAGRGGEIWARDYEWRDDRDYHWSVIDSTGAVIARVRTPSFLEIMEITAEGVIGSGRDEDGREHAWLYRLERKR